MTAKEKEYAELAKFVGADEVEFLTGACPYSASWLRFLFMPHKSMLESEKQKLWTKKQKCVKDCAVLRKAEAKNAAALDKVQAAERAMFDEIVQNFVIPTVQKYGARATKAQYAKALDSPEIQKMQGEYRRSQRESKRLQSAVRGLRNRAQNFEHLKTTTTQLLDYLEVHGDELQRDYIDITEALALPLKSMERAQANMERGDLAMHRVLQQNDVYETRALESEANADVLVDASVSSVQADQEFTSKILDALVEAQRQTYGEVAQQSEPRARAHARAPAETRAQTSMINELLGWGAETAAQTQSQSQTKAYVTAAPI